MKRSTILLSSIIVLLLASNAWFAYWGANCGVTLSYYDQQHWEDEAALDQTLAMLPVVAASPQDREAVIQAASRSSGQSASFERDGYLWVGRLGLKFGADNRLVKVVNSIEK